MTNVAYALSDEDVVSRPINKPDESAWDRDPDGRPEWKVKAQSAKWLAELVFRFEPPLWAEVVLGELVELLELPEGWNSYNARPIELSSVELATDLLFHCASPLVPRPAIVPTTRGGVQIEWHAGGDIEIEVQPDGRIGYLRGEEEREFDSLSEAVRVIKKELRQAFRQG